MSSSSNDIVLSCDYATADDGVVPVFLYKPVILLINPTNILLYPCPQLTDLYISTFSRNILIWIWIISTTIFSACACIPTTLTILLYRPLALCNSSLILYYIFIGFPCVWPTGCSQGLVLMSLQSLQTRQQSIYLHKGLINHKLLLICACMDMGSS